MLDNEGFIDGCAVGQSETEGCSEGCRLDSEGIEDDQLFTEGDSLGIELDFDDDWLLGSALIDGYADVVGFSDKVGIELGLRLEDGSSEMSGCVLG